MLVWLPPRCRPRRGQMERFAPIRAFNAGPFPFPPPPPGASQGLFLGKEAPPKPAEPQKGPDFPGPPPAQATPLQRVDAALMDGILSQAQPSNSSTEERPASDAPTEETKVERLRPDEDGENLAAVQSFIQAVWNVGEYVDIEDRVRREVEKHFRALAAAGRRKKEEDQIAHEMRADERFLARMQNLFQKEFKQLPHGPTMEETMLDLVTKCMNSIELLHKRMSGGQGAQGDLDETGEDEDTLFEGRVDSDKSGSELRPLWERKVLDVIVEGQLGLASAPTSKTKSDVYVPTAAKTVILSNLPLGVAKPEVEAALSLCGKIKHLELCSEWMDWSIALNPGISSTTDSILQNKADAPKQAKDTVRVRAPKYTTSYAIVEFEDEASFTKATRRALRLFGFIILEIQESVTKSGKASKKLIGRPAYPQDARFKHSILVRGLPWGQAPHDVLAELATIIGGEYTYAVANCRSFKGYRGLSVVSENGAATADPDYYRPPGFGEDPPEISNAEAAVLRFQTFEEAYAAREALKGQSLFGVPIVAGFPPWRPLYCITDAKGNRLERDVMVDLPLGRGSNWYDSDMVDPIHRFGTTVDVIHTSKNEAFQ